jgi:group I intron endonuclease
VRGYRGGTKEGETSLDLSAGRRFSTYFSHTYISSNKFPISKALLKYGYAEFRLEMIEYCEPKDVIQREQYYIDLLKPEYNILKVAGSLLGFKHSEMTREILANLYTGRAISEQVRAKMSDSQKGRVHTLEARAKMRISKLGCKLSEEHKANISAAALGKNLDESTKLKISGSKGTAIIVHDIETGEIKNFVSIKA